MFSHLKDQYINPVRWLFELLGCLSCWLVHIFSSRKLKEHFSFYHHSCCNTGVTPGEPLIEKLHLTDVKSNHKIIGVMQDILGKYLVLYPFVRPSWSRPTELVGTFQVSICINGFRPYFGSGQLLVHHRILSYSLRQEKHKAVVLAMQCLIRLLFTLNNFSGTSVVQVTATDADDPTYGNSARVVYSILQGQPYFSVEPKTGNCFPISCISCGK